MFRRLLFPLIFPQLLWAEPFNFPSNMTINDISTVVQSFTTGFLTRTPLSLLGQDKYKTQVGLEVITISVDKVSKLGSGSSNKDIQFQELSLSKRLPLDVEMGFQSSLPIMDRDVNAYGGYIRWAYEVYPWGSLSLLAHGASAQYKNILGANLYGAALNLDFIWQDFSISFGTGFVRSTNTFEPQLFGGTGPFITYGRQYAHQTVKISYLMKEFAISAQADWLKAFYGSFMLGYFF